MAGNGRGSPRIEDIVASGVYRDLAVLCPDLSDNALQMIAKKVGEDMPKVHQLWRGDSEYWAVDLLQLSRVQPGHVTDGMRMTAHRSLSKCETLDEALRSLTVLALLTSPIARAYSMGRGYVLRFMEGEIDPDNVQAGETSDAENQEPS